MNDRPYTEAEKLKILKELAKGDLSINKKKEVESGWFDFQALIDKPDTEGAA